MSTQATTQSIPSSLELVELVEAAAEDGRGDVGEMIAAAFEPVEDGLDTHAVGPDLGDARMRFIHP